ncbi:MAG TPA: iron-containing alcohol dehydrogenase, partial [Firmicutes bacterium]|nr:iron-containing alcohol dehydrogenase [Bacillota bacterium]
ALDKVLKYLKRNGKKTAVFEGVEPEVSVETVDAAAGFARKIKPDFIAGLGGGSAVDCAKAAAVIYKSSKSVCAYLDGDSEFPEKQPYIIAIPATSGTGAEVTKNAVLTYTRKNAKISLRTQKMVPNIVVADPELTMSMTPEITAYTGMDALTHAVESFFSLGANDFTRGISFFSTGLIMKNFLKSCKGDRTGRYNMMLASLTAGLAFANAGLGAVHGIGHPVGAVCKAGHGEINAVLLPFVVEMNRKKEKKRAAELDSLAGMRFERAVLRLVRKSRLSGRLSGLCPDVSVKITEILEKMVYTGSMSYNPVKMNRKKAEEIIKKAV